MANARKTVTVLLMHCALRCFVALLLLQWHSTTQAECHWNYGENKKMKSVEEQSKTTTIAIKYIPNTQLILKFFVCTCGKYCIVYRLNAKSTAVFFPPKETPLREWILDAKWKIARSQLVEKAKFLLHENSYKLSAIYSYICLVILTLFRTTYRLILYMERISSFHTCTLPLQLPLTHALRCFRQFHWERIWY